jgi:hypothetical protein
MKTYARSAMIAASLLVVSASGASAQIPTTLKFKTTFPFMVGRKTMPAGSYTITPLEIDHSLMEISNGRTAALILTEPETPKVQPRQDEVTFARQGDIYVLREIWDASSSTGAETPDAHARNVEHRAR